MAGNAGRALARGHHLCRILPDRTPGDRVRQTLRIEVATFEPFGLPSRRRSLAQLVDEAAARITRYSVAEAHAASAADGLIVDIRSEDARELHGVVPGSLHVPRTVLEWRIALDSPWRNAHLGGLDQRLILMCDHGYSSILAAGNLVELGFSRAGDLIGGFLGWRESGLPIAPYRRRASSPGELPGSGPPE